MVSLYSSFLFSAVVSRFLAATDHLGYVGFFPKLFISVKNISMTPHTSD